MIVKIKKITTLIIISAILCMFTLATLDAIALEVYGYNNGKSYRGCSESFSDLAKIGDNPEYKQVYKQLKNMETTILPEGITVEEMKRYMRYAQLKDTDLGYIYCYEAHERNGMIAKMYLSEEKKKAIIEKNSKAKEVLDSIKIDNRSEYSIAKSVYTELTSRISYGCLDMKNDDKSSPYSMPAYNRKGIYSIVIGEGDCQGMLKCYKYLCDKYGVNCEVVWDKEGKHMWDVVKIDNRWYNVDMTSGSVYEPMFCVNDDDYRRIMGYVSAFDDIKCTSRAPIEEIFVYPTKHLKRIRERTDWNTFEID